MTPRYPPKHPTRSQLRSETTLTSEHPPPPAPPSFAIRALWGRLLVHDGVGRGLLGPGLSGDSEGCSRADPMSFIASRLPFLLHLGPPNLLGPPKHVVGGLLRVHASGVGASPVRRPLEHYAFPARLGQSASDLALAHACSSSSSSFSQYVGELDSRCRKNGHEPSSPEHPPPPRPL